MCLPIEAEITLLFVRILIDAHTQSRRDGLMVERRAAEELLSPVGTTIKSEAHKSD